MMGSSIRGEQSIAWFSVERVTPVFSDSVNGMIRPVIYSRNSNLLFAEVCKHPVSKLEILAFGVIASRDTSLIGNDDKSVSQCLCGPTDIENTILESEGVTSVDVAALNIDNAISVQK
jgi:hypothetical protein